MRKQEIASTLACF